ncbi:hypothetical protein N0M98_11560 [Paenibacillus doosanensis]|uniref:hypothetical protein n=1 Tax=Paenibacillus konkukensis TaxID=2020716 RepID=UPI00201E4A1C|nr:hypothetical protein [Paenibacillus konkukensis]MCS7460781.1 hypothetical protein [Paenibacillus doosanensis]
MRTIHSAGGMQAASGRAYEAFDPEQQVQYGAPNEKITNNETEHDERHIFENFNDNFNSTPQFNL